MTPNFLTGNYTLVEWEDMTAKLIRPNLECVNGYIHIIDKVIMKRRDVTLSSGHKSEMAPIMVSLMVALAMIFQHRL